ncbi:alpha-(1,3)-fucosyltransferase 4 [Rhinatrema bivittatum]|uniref:alpha-(1,3)-fucosyltransferase 4 n=1 Tax=Rhinatrema bivittatum TaxID=194408 RepID=UPI001127EC27|nr:alpha-(1,3)-fucosyltransferase 4 [Rhinatrema bivittatum]
MDKSPSALRRCSPCRRNRCWRRLLAAGLTCTVLAVYACTPELPRLSALIRRRSPPEPRPVSVLVWWEPFGRWRRQGDCRLLFNISRCNVTEDRGEYGRAQAVLFHHRELLGEERGGLPAGARPAGQRWVWMNFESPSHTPWLEGLGGVFNWTMSYKVSSDIFLPYGYLRARAAEARAAVRLPRKSKLLAWVISNWNEEHARVRYYRRLARYLRVDVYGQAGLPLREDSVPRTVAPYKFYLAFENSQHEDYITEKLWRNALQAGAVPVVLGPSRANYERFIPRDAFIHVDDFSSPRKLARYLKFLDKNPPLYRRYFAWRKRYEVHVTSFWDEQFCAVCEAVRAAGEEVRTVPDLASWFED